MSYRKDQIRKDQMSLFEENIHGTFTYLDGIKSITDVEAPKIQNKTKGKDNPKKKKKSSYSPSYINNFLNEADVLEPYNFSKNVDGKSDLLKKYFKRFRSDGIQDLNKFDGIQIGAIFSNFYAGYVHKYR